MTTVTLLLSCCVGVLLGVMLFFAATATPTAFRKLPAEHAGTYIRSIFPVYYIWGIVLASIITALAYAVDMNLFTIAAAITVLFIFSRLVLMPAVNAARAARLANEKGAAARFKRLHMVSVVINLFQMVLLCVTVWLLTGKA